MGAVNLDTVKTRCFADRRGRREPGDDVLDLPAGQLPRCDGAGKVEGDSTGGDRNMSQGKRIGLAAGVIDLGENGAAGVLGCLCPARYRVQVVFILDDDVARFSELGAVDHDVAGDDQSISTAAPGGV